MNKYVKYKNKEYLYNQYIILQKTIKQISQETKIPYATLNFWLKRLDVLPAFPRKTTFVGEQIGKLRFSCFSCKPLTINKLVEEEEYFNPRVRKANIIMTTRLFSF